jgi:hypothetical protein
MNGDYLLVQMLHETRLREAAERRRHTEHRRLASASKRRRRRRVHGVAEAARSGRRWPRRSLRPHRLLAWVDVLIARR